MNSKLFQALGSINQHNFNIQHEQHQYQYISNTASDIIHNNRLGNDIAHQMAQDAYKQWNANISGM